MKEEKEPFRVICGEKVPQEEKTVSIKALGRNEFGINEEILASQLMAYHGAVCPGIGSPRGKVASSLICPEKQVRPWEIQEFSEQKWQEM